MHVSLLVISVNEKATEILKKKNISAEIKKVSLKIFTYKWGGKKSIKNHLKR